jgi:hypothetical protein
VRAAEVEDDVLDDQRDDGGALNEEDAADEPCDTDDS